MVALYSFGVTRAVRALTSSLRGSSWIAEVPVIPDLAFKVLNHLSLK